MNVNLVCVHEHALLRLGLRHVVANTPDITLVGEAATAAEALAVVARTRPTVVTIDANLPDGQGIALAHRLRTHFPTLGIVLVSPTDDDMLLYRAMDQGMSACVPMSAPAPTMISAIRNAAIAPNSFTAPGLAGALARRNAQGGTLSQRERQVLQLMRDGQTLRAIAATLHVTEATVKTYTARLYSKLEVNNRSQALMAAVNRGLLPTPADRAA